MHGDEPTATSALFDFHDYIRLHRADPIVKRMLDNLTIHVVPMLNPDGAERYQRRNAQDIDINRDAVRLQTPEGRALKALRDRLNPVLGFNLHNQNWGTSVGFPPKPASISLLAVAFNRERTDNERRILAKKTSAIIREAIEPLIPGQIGRYDDEFEVRAFGDNIAKWGTGVVLIETGPAPGDDPDRTLIRANFVAIVTALDALASGRVKKADPKRYETLPFNESRLLHTLVTGATLVGNPKLAPYTADIGIAGTRIVRRVSDESGSTESGAPGSNGAGGKRTLGLSARIADLGDLQTSGALNTIDAKGLTAAPLWDENLKQGDEVSLPDWSTWKGPTIAIGQPPNIVLLTRSSRASAAGAGVALSRGARHPLGRPVAGRSEVIPDRAVLFGCAGGAAAISRSSRRTALTFGSRYAARDASGPTWIAMPVAGRCSNRSSSVRSSPIATNSVVTGSSRTSACSARPLWTPRGRTSITLLPPIVSTTSPPNISWMRPRSSPAASTAWSGSLMR